MTGSQPYRETGLTDVSASYQTARYRFAGRTGNLATYGIAWLHLGPLHLCLADHRRWLRFHTDRKWRHRNRVRLHLGPWCLRVRVGTPHD